jgi:DNA-directed RNA polymerase specialized sigma subunit, sigma24 homolog
VLDVFCTCHGIIFQLSKRGDVLNYDKETLKKIEFLNEYGVIESRIRILRDRLENRKSCLYSLGAVKLDGMPKGGKTFTIADKVVEAVTIEDETAEKIEKLRAKQYKILEQIDAVGNLKYITVLELYYVEGLYWKEVADRLGVSERTVHTVHALALAKFTICS